MNTLFHFLLNMIILSYFIPGARENILWVLIGSTLIDLDHIPYLIKNWSVLSKKGLTVECRSFLHELLGVVIIIVVAWFGYMYYPIPVTFLFWSYILHVTLDFLMGTTRPFYPFSKMEITSPLKLRRYRNLLEAGVTVIAMSVVILWIL